MMMTMVTTMTMMTMVMIDRLFVLFYLSYFVLSMKRKEIIFIFSFANCVRSFPQYNHDVVLALVPKWHPFILVHNASRIIVTSFTTTSYHARNQSCCNLHLFEHHVKKGSTRIKSNNIHRATS